MAQPAPLAVQEDEEPVERSGGAYMRLVAGKAGDQHMTKRRLDRRARAREEIACLVRPSGRWCSP